MIKIIICKMRIKLLKIGPFFNPDCNQKQELHFGCQEESEKRVTKFSRTPVIMLYKICDNLKSLYDFIYYFINAPPLFSRQCLCCKMN